MCLTFHGWRLLGFFFFGFVSFFSLPGMHDLFFIIHILETFHVGREAARLVSSFSKLFLLIEMALCRNTTRNHMIIGIRPWSVFSSTKPQDCGVC